MAEAINPEIHTGLDQYHKFPVVIWGTKVAGQLCYRILRQLKANVVAAGDNDINQRGKIFYDIPVLSAEQVKELYPEALIVIGSFFYDVSDSIISQLESVSGRFSFCRFEELEYLYETRYSDRTVKDEEKLFQIINNIRQDEVYTWKRKLNTKVMSEYRYVVQNDRAEELKKVLSGIYGIKNLLLIVNSQKFGEALTLIDELSMCDSIGHIIVVLDGNETVDRVVMEHVVKKVFYVICDESASAELEMDLESLGYIVARKNLPDDLFSDRNLTKGINLTEDIVIQSVLQYVYGPDALYKGKTDRKTQPVHIVQLFNGLANQMLMYLFGRFLEEESDRIVIFDDTILDLDILDEEENIRRICRHTKALTVEDIRTLVSETRKRNSFYLFKRAEIAEVFKLQIRLLSDYFEEELWIKYLHKVKQELSGKYAQGFPLGQVLIQSGIDIELVRDSIMPDELLAVRNCYCVDAYILERPYAQESVTNFLLHNTRAAYYTGIWATGRVEDWLFNNREWMSSKFRFSMTLTPENKEYVNAIIRSDAIMLHIRRGDFVYNKMSADAQYFQKAIQKAEAMPEYKNKKYFIFSDDLSWCQQHEGELGIDNIKDKTYYVTGNVGKNCCIDMYLLSLGKVMIPTPGSSFSYVAMLISKTMEKCVNMPEYFYNLRHHKRNVFSFIDVKKV